MYIFDKTFAKQDCREQKMKIQRILKRCAVVAMASTMCTFGIGAPRAGAQSKTKTEPVSRGAKKKSVASKRATAKFALRAEALLATAPTSKGEWGLLVVDDESGEAL